MPLVSGRPPRSRWSGRPSSPPSLSLLVHLRHQAFQDDTGDLFFGCPGDESLLLASDDVDLVLGGAESYAFSGDIVAHHEVRSLLCELLAGVGHGVPVSRRESYHKEVRIPLPGGLEYVGRGDKLQARRPCAAPDLLPYLRGRREVRDRCGHDERVRVRGQIEDRLSQLLYGLDPMVSGPRLDHIYVGGTTVTPAPSRKASRATASPILPEERFPIKRALSMGSLVPPAVTSSRSPLIGPPRLPSSPATSSPLEAISPSCPSMMRRPSSRRSARFSRTAGWPAVPASRSGAMIVLAEKRPSMPRAILARVSAGAGAKSTASGVSEVSSTRATSRKAAGPTKRRALWPRITSTLLLPVSAISLATAGIARAPGEAPTERRITVLRLVPLSQAAPSSPGASESTSVSWGTPAPAGGLMKSSSSAAPPSSFISSAGCLKETTSLSWRNSSMAMVSGC